MAQWLKIAHIIMLYLCCSRFFAHIPGWYWDYVPDCHCMCVYINYNINEVKILLYFDICTDHCISAITQI